MHRHKASVITVVYALAALALGCADATAAGTGGVNAPGQVDKPYLVLVSLDGFGPAFRDLAETPALDRLEREGIAADAMQPVFPSLTFPNHYSIATGLYPAEHGIVNNRFPSRDRGRWYRLDDREAVQDGQWYGGEPIWVRAEKSGMVAAAFYFVGTEAAVAGVRPSHYRLFDADVPGEARVDEALRWLALPSDARPHVITLYFEDVDSASHDHGTDSAEARAAVARVDGYLARLLAGLEAQGLDDETYVVVVSDHGQANYVADDVFVLDEYVDLDGFDIVEGGSYAMLYADTAEADRLERLVGRINAAWDSGRAYLRSEVPSAWRVGDDPRYPDVIIQPDVGSAVLSSRELESQLKPADHGWPPEAPSMHAFFVAVGPGLPAGQPVGMIRSTDVYPLMLRMLDLEAPEGFEAAPSALDSYPEH